MRIDLPRCTMENFRWRFDGNCVATGNKREFCDFLKLLTQFEMLKNNHKRMAVAYAGCGGCAYQSTCVLGKNTGCWTWVKKEDEIYFPNESGIEEALM